MPRNIAERRPALSAQLLGRSAPAAPPPPPAPKGPAPASTVVAPAAAVGPTSYDLRDLDLALVLTVQPASGAVSVPLAATTLSFVSDGAGGLLAQNAAGKAQYHLAAPSAVDRRGKVGGVALAVAAGKVSLTLDAGYAAAAAYPVVVRVAVTRSAKAVAEANSAPVLTATAPRAWGRDSEGEVGNGSFAPAVTSPVQVVNLAGATSLAAGGYLSIAARSDGSVWTWGDDGYGQLGNNTVNQPSDTPVQVLGPNGAGTLSGVKAVAAGGFHALALMASGGVEDWGLNDAGQLGNLSTNQSSLPVVANGLTGMNAVAGRTTAWRPRPSAVNSRRRSATTGCTGCWATARSYSYDPVGNWLTVTQGGAPTSYTSDRADRLTAIGALAVTTTANGNLTAVTGSGLNDAFSYDQANRLASASLPPITITSTYDGDGNRTSTTTGGVVTTYVNDVSGGLAVLLGDGGRKYVWGHSVDSGGNVLVSHDDGLGSIRNAGLQ